MNSKKFHLINFATRNEGFGKDLGIILANMKETTAIHFGTASDYLLDLGNGFDIKPTLLCCDAKICVDSSDLVFMRKRQSLGFYSTLVVQFFDLLGAKIVNKVRYFESNDNISKQAQYINLVKNGFRIPRTILVNGASTKKFKSYIESVLDYPMVLKGKGACGREVFKVNSFSEIENHISEMSTEKTEAVILQEFVKTSHEEYRVVFMLGRVIAVIIRSSQDFLNNHAQGGSLSTTELPASELSRCVEAANISGLDYLGVDYMRDKSGNMIFLELQTGPSINVTKEIEPEAVSRIANILASASV